MKFKKIISLVSALAISLSMFAALNVEAASLGGKPAITASFAGYEIDAEYGNEIVAKIILKIDVSAAEELAAYASSGKGSNKVETGNGITTLGATWAVTSTNGSWEYWDDFNDSRLSLSTDATNLTFGPEATVANYLLDEIIEVPVRYASYDTSVSGKVEITDFTVDGDSTTDGNRMWGYSYILNTATAVGCDIPSYDEWSNPTPSVPDDTVIAGTVEDDAELGLPAAPFYINATIKSGKTPFWKADITKDGVKKSYKKAAETANLSGSGSVKLGLVYVGTETISNVSLAWE